MVSSVFFARGSCAKVSANKLKQLQERHGRGGGQGSVASSAFKI